MNLNALPSLPPATADDHVEGLALTLPQWTTTVREHGSALEAYKAATQHMLRLVKIDLIRSFREFWEAVPEETALRVMWEIGSSSDYFDIQVNLEATPATHLDVIRAHEALRDACESVPVSKDILWPLAERSSPFRGLFTRPVHLAVLAQAEQVVLDEMGVPLHRHLAHQRAKELTATSPPAVNRRRRRS